MYFYLIHNKTLSLLPFVIYEVSLHRSIRDGPDLFYDNFLFIFCFFIIFITIIFLFFFFRGFILSRNLSLLSLKIKIKKLHLSEVQIGDIALLQGRGFSRVKQVRETLFSMETTDSLSQQRSNSNDSQFRALYEKGKNKERRKQEKRESESQTTAKLCFWGIESVTHTSSKQESVILSIAGPEKRPWVAIA